MFKVRKNEKGGAAVVALLIIIMFVAIVAAVMVVSGRNSIEPVKKNKPAESSIIDSSSDIDSQSDSSQDDSSQGEPEPLMNYPEKSLNYKDIKIDGLTTKYGILVDADNNAIISGMNYDKKIYPASLTKIMTLIVAVENMDDLGKKFEFSSGIIDPLVEKNAARAGFKAGEKVTYEDLLYSSILVSGADATTAIATAVAGSEEAFVEMMNEKAKVLGLTGTHFTNPIGLHNKEHYTTCLDLAVITEYAMKNELCMKILTTSQYTTSKTKQNENGIVLDSLLSLRLQGYYIEGGGDILGGKTGFTDQSGNSLVTITNLNGKKFVCVTIKSDGELTSVEDNIAIYEKYLPFDNTSSKSE